MTIVPLGSGHSILVDRGLRSNLLPLLKYALSETWWLWLMAGVGTVCSGLFNYVVPALTNGATSPLDGFAFAANSTWFFGWTLLLFVNGMLQATSAIPHMSLAGVGPRTIRIVHCLSTLITVAGALIVWAIGFLILPTQLHFTDGTTLDSLKLGPVSGWTSGTWWQVVIMAFVWAVFAAFGQALGHAYRRGPRLTLVVAMTYGVILIACVGALVLFLTDGGSVITLALCLVALSSIMPTAWVLAGAGPIRFAQVGRD
ncbi:hypothetical protein [Actinomyces procaprae]|uniref:hypothetical protein n=1 Tax=Actinomyces procaprae TaxID=2560010 RepID=UPI00109E0E29|nr:hypothetical protein [Actinomyces procaprae]